jgi:hypothetical protein
VGQSKEEQASPATVATHRGCLLQIRLVVQLHSGGAPGIRSVGRCIQRRKNNDWRACGDQSVQRVQQPGHARGCDRVCVRYTCRMPVRTGIPQPCLHERQAGHRDGACQDIPGQVYQGVLQRASQRMSRAGNEAAKPQCSVPFHGEQRSTSLHESQQRQASAVVPFVHMCRQTRSCTERA